MRLSRITAFLPSALLCLAFLLPSTPAEARPRGRKWESLGVVGFPGDCYEVWVRDHWLWGWQTVYEPVPCPERRIAPSNVGVVFSDHPAFVALSEDGQSLPWVFGDAVPFVFQASDTSMGPVLCYGKQASLVELTAEGEELFSVLQEPVDYSDRVWVREGFKLDGLFTGPHQAALVTFSADYNSLKAVHSVVAVEPVQE